MAKTEEISILHCENCKSEIKTSDFFFSHSNWGEILKLFHEKGIDNPEFIQLTKKQSKGLCFNCGSMNACKSAMIWILAGPLEKNVFDDVILFYNTAMSYDEFVYWIIAINIAEEIILKIKLDIVKAHAILVALIRLNGKPQYVDEKEKELMFILKEKARLSNQDLSTIFQIKRNSSQNLKGDGEPTTGILVKMDKTINQPL